MSKVPSPPKGPLFPWGAAKTVRERLVDPSQVERRARANTKRRPGDPALPSMELLEFIGAAPTGDASRLPPPPPASNHRDAELAPPVDRDAFAEVLARSAEGEGLEAAVGVVRAPPERIAAMRAALDHEARMIACLRELHLDVAEVHRRMRDERKEEGY